MKKLLLLLFTLTLFQQLCFAQGKTIDSLKRELLNTKQDTTRLRIYLALCEAGDLNINKAMFNPTPDTVDLRNNFKYGEQVVKLADKLLTQTINGSERKKILKQKALALSYISGFYLFPKNLYLKSEYDKKRLAIYQEINDTAYIIGTINILSLDFRDMGNIPKVLEYYQKGLSISKEMNYKKGIENFLSAIAGIYKEQGDYSQALENSRKALLLNYELKDTINLQRTLETIGIIYGYLHNTRLANEYLYKAILLLELKKDNISVIADYNILGQMYAKNNDFSNAMIYYQKGLSMAESLKISGYLRAILGNIGKTYLKQNNIEKALEFHYKALEIGGANNPYSCEDLANDYLKQKNYTKAKYYSDCYYKEMSQASNLENCKNAEQLAAKVDSCNKNYADAYWHYKKYILLRDKLNSEEVRKAATQEKFQTEYDKQTAADKALQEKKDEIAKAESKKQKLVIVFIGVGLLLVLVFAGFIFRSLRIRNKQNKIIFEQKTIVEEKQKEILDSIEYALRIQTAILPPQKIVKQYLENSFILYKPKDIVAGDFYWMETVNDLVLFAACDCTGHGVPGAMVSVVCHNALNRAVREFGLTQPAAILDKTAEIVIENFSKSEEDIKDGMDISLCAYNAKTKTIQWAGANNPLWLLQNGELIETKADKQPIGMNEDSKPFTNHTFNLNPTDTIYLFTDGFADQFGGDTGQKKLTKRGFKDLILSVQNKPLHEQGIALDKFITEFRKSVEQIDDILVMGVKV